MESAVKAWKLLKPKDWPQVDNALDFARAGYAGFPVAGTVPNDDRYKDCKACKLTFCEQGLGSSWPSGQVQR